MFTNENFIGYFNQILNLEKKMAAVYRSVYEQLSHSDYRKIFEQLYQEEQLHQNRVLDVIKLFQENG